MKRAKAWLYTQKTAPSHDDLDLHIHKMYVYNVFWWGGDIEIFRRPLES